jgi:hypothetical protein
VGNIILYVSFTTLLFHIHITQSTPRGTVTQTHELIISQIYKCMSIRDASMRVKFSPHALLSLAK